MSDPVSASVPDVSVTVDNSVILKLVNDALLANPTTVAQAVKLYKDLCVHLAQAVVNMLPAEQQKDALMLLWVEKKVEDVVEAVNCKKCW